MKYFITIIFLILSLLTKAQGILHSYVKQDTVKLCTLTVRNIDYWDKSQSYIFKVATVTALQPGDYMISYMVEGNYIHSEWIHIGKYKTKIDKIILVKPLKLTEITFIKPKNIILNNREKFYEIE